MPCVLSIPISQCIEWLLGTAHPMHWATVYFCGHCYGHLTSNIVESLNVWLLQARGLPIEGMLEAIREKLMGWFAERCDFATKHHDLRLVPEVHSYLCNEGSTNGRRFKLQSITSSNRAREYRSMIITDNEYEVQHAHSTFKTV